MQPKEPGIPGQPERRTGSPRPGDSKVASLRSFVAAEQEHLFERHRYGLGGREIARGRSDLVDLVVSRACRLVAEDLGPSARDELAACAVVATGGYGRRQLCPHSDVDLLVIHPDRLTSAQEAFVESSLPLLWDSGLAVAHGVRSVTECVELARVDIRARNAMSETRLVTGDAELFRRLTAEMRSQIYTDAKANRFFADAMRTEIAERRARFGSVVGLSEPNIRDGAGGLRDLHLIGWVALARYGLADPDDLLRAELLTASEHRRALRASDALLRVRNELHFRTGRRTDVLSLELQPAVAERMGYADRHFASASELFMRDLYHRADELLRVTEAFLVRADFWSPAPRRFVPTWKRTVSGSGQRRYLIRGRYLHPHPSGEEPRRDAMGLFEPFRVAQRHGVDVAPELKELVRSRLGLVDRAVRHSPDSADAFMDILRQRQGAGRALRALHESGLLSRYMPELRRISLMVQHDHHHRYTIDEHTLRVVEALDELARSQDHQRTILRDALEGVEDHAVLALAALLHDVGKGRGAGADHATRGATIAKRVCRRIGIAEAKLEDVVFLVQKHLVMSRTSQRRDLSDEALLQGFADTVVTVDRLNMLYVLTYADLSGVAPGSWSEWKGALLAELYLKTLARLTGDRSGQAAGDKRGSPADRVLRQLSPEFLRSDVDEFLAHLPSRYARALPPLLIARHFELVRELGPRTIAVDWSDSGKDPFTVLSVCAPDAPGLLAHLAGALTGSGLDVLSLDVFTRDDGIALDVFRVCEAMGASSAGAVAEELRSRAVQALESAARGELDPAVAVERQRRRQKRRKRGRTHRPADVRFEPPDAFGRTLIEVRADDEPGVLYRIASTLSAQGLNISYAKVASEKDQALDVFYVESVDRQPIPRARQVEIRDALLEGLRGSPSGSLGAVG